MVAHHRVKDAGKPVANAPPLPHLGEAEFRGTSELAEVLVRDRVSPLVQFLELLWESMMALRVVRLDVVPERVNESAEIVADTAGLRIPLGQVELSVQRFLDNWPQIARIDLIDQELGALGIKIASEALEMRRE